MDYINYVKEYPMMGQIGLGGGATSLGRYAGGEPVPDGSTFFGDRGIIAGGRDAYSEPPEQSGIDVKNLTTTGNASTFGNLIGSYYYQSGATDSVRGIIAGGRKGTGDASDMIQYQVIPTGGATVDFGNLSPESRSAMSSASDGTRAIFCGGGGDDDWTGHDSCCIITTQTVGNATTAGDLPANRIAAAGASNGTRGIVAGGSSNAQPSTISQYIYYFTMASFGSGTTASEFGSLHTAFTHGGGTQYAGAGSNTTRLLYMMGSRNHSPGIQNQCVYITVATTGNASDFGDCGDKSGIHGFNNATRCGYGGGINPGYSDGMAYFTIATLGNCSGWGDLTSQVGGQGATSGVAS